MTYFFIISNGRTGSTWLSSLLNDCDDLITRGEIKWSPVGFVPGPHHIVMDARTQDLTKLLDRHIENDEGDRLGEVRGYGSKLVLDPQSMLEPSVYDCIAASIPSDVPLIHLRRSYLEIFLSFNSRGAVHRISDKVRRGDVAGLDRTMCAQLVSSSPDDRPPQLILISWHPVRLFLLHRLLRGSQVHVIDLADFIQEILTYFLHDIYIMSFMKARADACFTDYSEIHARFFDLAVFVGSRISPARAKEVLGTPLVEKLPDLVHELAWPTQMASYFCRVMDEEARAFAASSARATDLIDWDAATRSFAIRSQPLFDFMTMSQAAWVRRFRPIFRLERGGAVRVFPTKPIRSPECS